VLTASNSSRLQTFNPLIGAPVRGRDWEYGPAFGHPLTRLAYQSPRSYGCSMGLRF
jgi:hypothetical protein